MLNAQQALQLTKNKTSLKETVEVLLLEVSEEIKEAAEDGAYSTELEFIGRFQDKSENDKVLLELAAKLSSLGFLVKKEEDLLFIDWSGKTSSEEELKAKQNKSQFSELEDMLNSKDFLCIAKQLGIDPTYIQKYGSKISSLNLGDIFHK